MPDTIALSESALALLRLRAERRRADVTPENLDAYRELVRAGIMYPVSGFTRGPEAIFRFTEDGWNRREEWIRGLAPRP
jgi:aspartyl/asparaginyl-tRNA synthetase